MNNNKLSLSHQFEMEVLRRFVEDNPEKAPELVLKLYQQYSELEQEYQTLEKAHLKYLNGIFM